MIARSQRVFCLLLLALAIGAGWALRDHGPWASLAGFLGVVCVHAGVLVIEFAALRWINRDDPAPRASWPQMARAWASEVVAAAVTFGWRQPFRASATPDWLPARPVGTPAPRGVVLIHGFLCNRGIWTPWFAALRSRGHAHVAVNLEPVFGSIDDYVTIIDRAVREVHAATGLPPVLVCHSMGGLAARAWLRWHRATQPQTEAPPPVAHVVTIATPHHGTVFAQLGHGRNARQMRRVSPWRQALAADEQARGVVPAARFTCWYTHGDNIVAPTATAMLPGADNRFVPARGHVALALHPEVIDGTLRVVAAA